MNQYPENVVRIMRPQIQGLRRTIAHHFKRRHDGRGSRVVRMWIEELRRVDRASGYSDCAKQAGMTP